jgi:hypothetical protein
VISLDEFIIRVYCEVEAHMQTIGQLRSRGFAPGLTDGEVITMEIVGEFLGHDTDKGIWRYFRQHWQSWFPKLTTRETFVRRAANLCWVKQCLQQRFAQALDGFNDKIHMVDGFPIPLCVLTRAPRCRSFKGEANYGYCAAKKQHYYGFHGHILISSVGIITGFTLTPANGSERDCLWELTQDISGLLIGDKGYLSSTLQEELQEEGINLQTSVRKNMKETRTLEFVKKLISMRRLIETVNGQLTARFNIEKVWARDLWHLTNRLGRKILAHTLAVLLNCRCGAVNPLQLDGLLAV